MDELIKNIKAALKGNAPMAALALALTVPDICAQIEYPAITMVGERYKNWFHAHLNQYYKDNFTLAGNSLGMQEFNADVCYKLRCALLHSGNADTDLKVLNEMRFWVPDANAEYADCDTGIVKRMPDGSRHKTIILNITQFCENVCCAAKDFYDSWPQKDDFDKHEIHIAFGDSPKS